MLNTGREDHASWGHRQWPLSCESWTSTVLENQKIYIYIWARASNRRSFWCKATPWPARKRCTRVHESEEWLRVVHPYPWWPESGQSIAREAVCLHQESHKSFGCISAKLEETFLVEKFPQFHQKKKPTKHFIHGRRPYLRAPPSFLFVYALLYLCSRFFFGDHHFLLAWWMLRHDLVQIHWFVPLAVWRQVLTSYRTRHIRWSGFCEECHFESAFKGYQNQGWYAGSEDDKYFFI